MSKLDQHSGKFSVAYLLSIWIAGQYCKVPYVFDTTEIIFFAASGIWFIYILYLISKNHLGASILLGHLAIGILLHPALPLNGDTTPSKNRQIEIIIELHQPQKPLSERLALTTDMAKTMKDEAMFLIRYNNYLLYWAYPISVIFWIWGFILFMLLRNYKLDTN